MPVSVTHGATALAGFIAFLLSSAYIYHHSAMPTVLAALLVIGALAMSMFGCDLYFTKVYLRPGTGLDFSRHSPSWPPTLRKFPGLLDSLGFIALLYWLFPEYHGSFYDRYYDMLRLVLPVWIVLALPYFYFIDARMRNPFDGYWQMGCLATLQWDKVDMRAIRQHLLSWLVKGYFLPLMFIYMCDDVDQLRRFDVHAAHGLRDVFDTLFTFGFYTDVSFVALGYLVSLRLTDTHVRSAEPTLLGWVAALVCYQPFWSLIGGQYLHYDSDYDWKRWLGGSPWLYDAWGAAILLLLAIYAWATVAFGARFSNLTDRGILTNGPYRYSKHPAYVSKNLAWWLLSVPFLVHGSVWETLRRCILLLLINGIYLLRAKTEEWHLSRSPEYIAYARAMQRTGLLRFLHGVPGLRLLCLPLPQAA